MCKYRRCSDTKEVLRGIGLTLGLVFCLTFVQASPLDGQIQRTVGIHLGQIRAKQLWDDPISGGSADGVMVGVNVDVPTPARLLSVRAGASYVQRGSVVWDEVLDPERQFPANVRSHYLSIPVQGKLGFRFGPGGIYLLAGPTVDLLLETQCPQDLCRLLDEERPSVLSMTVGTGVSFDFRDRFRVDLEVWLTEGLTEAYSSTSTGVRYRSMGVLFRTCLPF
jgi:hypothetical protein